MIPVVILFFDDQRIMVLGFQGNDNDMSSYSATYTIVPGMQFEIGSLDDGTNSTSSAELQMSF